MVVFCSIITVTVSYSQNITSAPTIPMPPPLSVTQTLSYINTTPIFAPPEDEEGDSGFDYTQHIKGINVASICLQGLMGLLIALHGANKLDKHLFDSIKNALPDDNELKTQFVLPLPSPFPASTLVNFLSKSHKKNIEENVGIPIETFVSLLDQATTDKALIPATASSPITITQSSLSNALQEAWKEKREKGGNFAFGANIIAIVFSTLYDIIELQYEDEHLAAVRGVGSGLKTFTDYIIAPIAIWNQYHFGVFANRPYRSVFFIVAHVLLFLGQIAALASASGSAGQGDKWENNQHAYLGYKVLGLVNDFALLQTPFWHGVRLIFGCRCCKCIE